MILRKHKPKLVKPTPEAFKNDSLETKPTLQIYILKVLLLQTMSYDHEDLPRLTSAQPEKAFWGLLSISELKITSGMPMN